MFRLPESVMILMSFALLGTGISGLMDDSVYPSISYVAGVQPCTQMSKGNIQSVSNIFFK